MRVYLFMFFLLTIGCVENKEQKIENIKIDKELAEELVSLSIKCVDQKYPYKIGYRFIDKNWVKPHYEITPSFSTRLSRGCVSRCCSMLFQPNASM